MLQGTCGSRAGSPFKKRLFVAYNDLYAARSSRPLALGNPFKKKALCSLQRFVCCKDIAALALPAPSGRTPSGAHIRPETQASPIASALHAATSCMRETPLFLAPLVSVLSEGGGDHAE